MKRTSIASAIIIGATALLATVQVTSASWNVKQDPVEAPTDAKTYSMLFYRNLAQSPLFEYRGLELTSYFEFPAIEDEPNLTGWRTLSGADPYTGYHRVDEFFAAIDDYTLSFVAVIG